MTPAALKVFLGVLKEAGVRRFSDTVDNAPMTVEFFPPPGLIAEEAKPQDMRRMLAAAAEALDGQKCPCGHLLAGEHSDAGCLEGCEAEKCNPAPTGVSEATT